MTKSVTDSLILIGTTGRLTNADGTIEDIFFCGHDGRSNSIENIQERGRRDVKDVRGESGRMGATESARALQI